MLTVTDKAVKRLRQALANGRPGTGRTIRMIPSRGKNQFTFTMDTRKENDQLVKDREGALVLLVGNEVTKVLDGMVLDYRENGGESHFVISERE